MRLFAISHFVRILQECFKNASRIFWGMFKDVSSIGDTSRMFWGMFKDVSSICDTSRMQLFNEALRTRWGWSKEAWFNQNTFLCVSLKDVLWITQVWLMAVLWDLAALMEQKAMIVLFRSIIWSRSSNYVGNHNWRVSRSLGI